MVEGHLNLVRIQLLQPVCSHEESILFNSLEGMITQIYKTDLELFFSIFSLNTYSYHATSSNQTGLLTWSYVVICLSSAFYLKQVPFVYLPLWRSFNRNYQRNIVPFPKSKTISPNYKCLHRGRLKLTFTQSINLFVPYRQKSWKNVAYLESLSMFSSRIIPPCQNLQLNNCTFPTWEWIFISF